MSGPPRDDSARCRRLDDRTLSSTLSVLEVNSGADVFWSTPGPTYSGHLLPGRPTRAPVSAFWFGGDEQVSTRLIRRDASRCARHSENPSTAKVLKALKRRKHE